MPETSNDVQDIFSDVETASPSPTIEPVVPTESVETPRRWIWIIASSLGGLILLSAVGFGVYWWLQQRSNNTTSTITTTTNLTIPTTNTTTTNISIPVINVTTYSDADYDGLSDDEELEHNTNPKKKDTDEDGLSDREEVRVYLTDPRANDTDGDGYSDGIEVENFYHPNHPDPTKRLFDLE
ncbi:MAG: hypothetical protein HYV33_00135 [Candidatus Kerfeldbacteria bacterium]|nr:hypothetical protein [Candidatus Kerfeldbacteria bacterium]